MLSPIPVISLSKMGSQDYRKFALRFSFFSKSSASAQGTTVSQRQKNISSAKDSRFLEGWIAEQARHRADPVCQPLAFIALRHDARDQRPRLLQK